MYVYLRHLQFERWALFASKGWRERLFASTVYSHETHQSMLVGVSWRFSLNKQVDLCASKSMYMSEQDHAMPDVFKPAVAEILKIQPQRPCGSETSLAWPISLSLSLLQLHTECVDLHLPMQPPLQCQDVVVRVPAVARVLPHRLERPCCGEHLPCIKTFAVHLNSSS